MRWKDSIEGVCAYVDKVYADCGVPAGSIFPLRLVWPETSQLSVRPGSSWDNTVPRVFLLVAV